MKLNIKKVIIILVSFFCLMPIIIKSQEQLSLSEILDLALKNNKSLRVSAMELDAAILKSNTVVALPKTSFSGLFGQMNSYRFDENLSISQEIPNPSSIKAQRKLASAEAGLISSKISIDKNEIRYSIKQSWYEWLYLKELRKVLMQEDSVMSKFLKVAAVKLKTGESGILEKSTAEFHKSQIGQKLNHIDMLMENELLKIKMYLGQDKNFEPVESFQALSFNSDSSITNNPVFLYLKEQSSVFEAQYQTIKSDRLPDFNVGYFIQSLAGPQEINSIQKTFTAIPQFQGFELGINVPIFGSKAYNAKIQSIEILKNANESQKENMSWQLNQQLRQSFNEYIFWSTNIQFYESTAIPNAEFIITNANKAYTSGEVDYVEYLQSIRNGLQTRKEYLEAINNQNKSVLKVNYLIGK